MKFSLTHKSVAALLIASIALLAGCSKTDRVAERVQKAERHFEAGKYAAAEIELKNALRYDPRNGQAIAMMGEIFVKQGRFRLAFPYLNATKNLQPENLENRLNLSTLLMAAGRPEMALEEAKLVLEKDPANAKAPLVLADSVRSPELAQQATEILKTLPESPAVLTAEGFIDLKGQSFSNARALFDKAVSLDPEFSSAHMGKYALSMSQQRFESATEEIRKAADYSEPRSGLSIAYANHLISQFGKVDEAIAYLETRRETAPDFLPVLSRLSELYVQKNEQEKAKQLNEEALALDPQDATALRVKAVFEASEGKHEAAIATLTGALSIYPRDIKAHYQIALSYVANKQSEEAKKHLQFVVANNPTDFEAASLLSSLQADSGDLSGAIITLKRLIANRPEEPAAKLMLAEALNKQGNYNAALAIYDEVEKSVPKKLPELDYLSGVTQLRQDNRNEARNSFEQALQSNPLHLQSVEQLTALDLSEKRYDAALSRVEQSLTLSPDNAILHMVKAQILNAMQQPEKAEESFKKALEVDPKNRTALMLLSRFYLRNERAEEALGLLDRILEDNPQDIVTLTSKASIFELQEKKDEARQTYETILEIAPDNLSALNNLAYLISTTDGPTDRALELAEKARELAPVSPYTTDTLGWILYQRGEYARARALLIDSVTRLPEHPEVNYHIGAAQYMIGDLSQAIDRLRIATAEGTSYNGVETAKRFLKTALLDPANADAEDQQSLEAHSDKDPIALSKLGLIALANEDGKEAVSDFEKALKISPANLYAKIGLSKAYIQQGDASKALILLRDTVKQFPNNADANYALGDAAFATGDYSWAASIYSAATRQFPQNPTVFKSLSQSQLAIGQLENARDAATRWNALASNDESAQFLAGLDHLAGGSDAPELTAKDEITQLLASLIQAQDSVDSEQSQKNYQDILKKYPTQTQAQLGLALILAQDTDTAPRAIEIANSVRLRVGQSPKLNTATAIAQYRTGQFEKAASTFDRLPESQKRIPLVQAYQGLTLLQVEGKTAEAKQLLTTSLEKGQLDDKLITEITESMNSGS